jgi:phospho-N-acetylmuramoyl-pentapeptide-transferase
VKDVLGAAVIAFLLGIIAGPAFIAFLRRNEFGQHIREDGPAGHQSKQGTPTMGGVIMIGCALIAFAIFNSGTLTGWTVAAVTVACAGIGFADDYFKLRHRRSLGLSGRVKMLLLALVAAALGLVVHSEHLGTDVYVPLINVHLAMGPVYYVFLFLVVAGATNAVNLTDGLDGLAAGTTTIALASYSAIMLVAFLVTPKDHAPMGLRPPGDHVSLDLAIISAALVGGAIGFLWYNAYPADVFMGDTGSFGLGGALAAMAVFTKTEFLLVVIGGIFVIEAMSVLIQVVAFKTTGKRVFLMAPIHHHFEMMEWTENKIIVRFWIAGAIFGASGFVLYYLYFSSYR